jgi:hypothetical protein
MAPRKESGALAPGRPGEAAQKVAPPLRARHPGLLVCRAKSLLRETNCATSSRLGLVRINLVDFGQRLLFLERRWSGVRGLPRTEQFFPESFFHCCAWWLIVRRTQAESWQARSL